MVIFLTENQILSFTAARTRSVPPMAVSPSPTMSIRKPVADVRFDFNYVAIDPKTPQLMIFEYIQLPSTSICCYVMHFIPSNITISA